MAAKPKKPASSSLEAAQQAIEAALAGAGGPAPGMLGPSDAAIKKGIAAGTIPADFKPFQEEDEWGPLSWSDDDRDRMKTLMKASGLYGPGGIVMKGWTTADAKAAREVLAFANSMGISDELEAAKQYASEAETSGLAARAPRAQLVSRFANPESVRQVVRATSMDLLGMRLSDAEEARIVAGFQNQYQESQRAQHAAQTGATSADGITEGIAGSYTEALSAEEYAESQLVGTKEAGAKRYLDAFDGIVQSMSGTVVEGPRLTGQGGVA